MGSGGLVITGWYSSVTPRDYFTYGSDINRSTQFRSLWERSIKNFIDPSCVYITDSASPVPVESAGILDCQIVVNRLLTNPGHSQNCQGHYCGATAAIISGLEYALHSGVDMVIYVEQDALLWGRSLLPELRRLIGQCGVVFAGRPGGEIEHTVMGFRRDAIRPFLANLHQLAIGDRFLQPEFKFMIAQSQVRRLPVWVHRAASYHAWYILRRLAYRTLSKAAYLSRGYQVLPFGYGRARPIDFSADCFYFQQASQEELDSYKALMDGAAE